MINTSLLEATMAHIRDFPELHEQVWFFIPTECGTAMCFAGRACQLAGLEQVSPLTFSARVYTDEGIQSARQAAEKLLGLTHEEAGTLFSGGNTLANLEAMVKDLANGGLRGDVSFYWGL